MEIAPEIQRRIEQILSSNIENMSAYECGVHGEELLVVGFWEAAERLFKAQLEKGIRESDLNQQAIACCSLGGLFGYHGDVANAMALCQQGLALAERISNQRLIGTIYNEMGEVERRQGDYQQAVLYYNKSLEIAASVGNDEGLASTYGNLGIIYKNQGDYPRAFQSYEKSLEYSIRLGSDRLTANQYSNLGVLYEQQGRYALAIEMQQKSLDICLKLGYQKTAANAYANLGNAYHLLDNYSVAREMYEKALAIMQRIGDEPGEAITYGNLAVVYHSMGDIERATTFYSSALQILERVDDKPHTAGNCNNLGLLYYEQGQPDQARIYLQKAQKLFEILGDQKGTHKVTAELQRLESANTSIPLKILGKCRPGEKDGCTDPLSPIDLDSMVATRHGTVHLFILGQFEIPPPPGITRAITDFVERPENKRFGLFHFKEIKAIWIRSKTIEKILDVGLFAPGNYYYQLVYAVNAIGLEAVDVDYIFAEQKQH